MELMPSKCNKKEILSSEKVLFFIRLKNQSRIIDYQLNVIFIINITTHSVHHKYFYDESVILNSFDVIFIRNRTKSQTKQIV